MNAKHIQDQSKNTSLTPEEIAARAYEIYEREGRADGRDFDHWVRAESELRAERSGKQEERAPGPTAIGNGSNGDGSPTPPETSPGRTKPAKRPPARSMVGASRA